MNNKIIVPLLCVAFVVLSAFYIKEKIDESVQDKTTHIIESSNTRDRNDISERIFISGVIAAVLIGSYTALIINHPELDKKQIARNFRDMLRDIEDEDLKHDLLGILLPYGPCEL